MHQDTEITCADCQTPFTFSASEQAFFEEKGFTPPKRCKSCRAARKAQKESGDGGGSYNSAPRQDRRGGGGGGSRQMYDVTCSDCGVKTQVPFQPSGDRPVYCRDCFKGTRR